MSIRSSPQATATRGPIRIELDWDGLELAVERNSPDSDSYLDLINGRVLTVIDGDPEAALLRQQIADAIRNFLRVEPASSREQYRWMERFVGSVSDEPLRERLLISIDGKGAFRRFKDVLLTYPAERERWFTYRADLLHWHIQLWLEQHLIEASNEPPWGVVTPPAELPLVALRPALHGGEAPGESLRRQARELVETIPAIELPTAIAFLEFLRQRAMDHSSSGFRDDDRNDVDDDVDDDGDNDRSNDRNDRNDDDDPARARPPSGVTAAPTVIDPTIV